MHAYDFRLKDCDAMQGSFFSPAEDALAFEGQPRSGEKQVRDAFRRYRPEPTH